MVLKDTRHNKILAYIIIIFITFLWYNILAPILKLRYVSLFDHVRFLTWAILLHNLKTL